MEWTRILLILKHNAPMDYSSKWNGKWHYRTIWTSRCWSISFCTDKSQRHHPQLHLAMCVPSPCAFIGPKASRPE